MTFEAWLGSVRIVRGGRVDDMHASAYSLGWAQGIEATDAGLGLARGADVVWLGLAGKGLCNGLREVG